MALQRPDARLVPPLPSFRCIIFESSPCPGLKPVLDKLAQCCTLLLADANQSFGKARAVRSFHFAGDLVIALLRGLTDNLAVPHELVPIDVAAFVNGHCLTVLSFFGRVIWGACRANVRMHEHGCRIANNWAPNSISRPCVVQ